MDWPTRFLQHRLREELAWERTRDPQATEDDAMQYLHDQCGWENGTCRYAMSEYCALDCPFRPEGMGC